jgi:peroxiredoxin
VVLGITFSSSEELKTWATETGVTTNLLCDADRLVALAYGAADSADQEKPSRVSVLIGADGKIRKTYTVSDAEGHPSEVIMDLS